MFVHLTNRTKFLVHVVRSFIKRTNINELPTERFTNCSLNVWFVYSPRCNRDIFVIFRIKSIHTIEIKNNHITII
ncbi:hypothetical protein Hanom_Chr09g00828081 [Helianthus anomalus]